MSPCICIDESSSMFKVIKVAHYWQPVVELSIRVGDIIYFEKRNTGVVLSKTDNPDHGFIFFSEGEFEKHFKDLCEKRDNRIDELLGE